MSDNNQVALRPERSDSLPVSGVYGSIQSFEDAQRMAKALAASNLVPQDYQGNTANTLIALEMAQRTGSSPMAVMQNMHVIHGRPSWSSQFVIAALNSCGRFSPLRFRVQDLGERQVQYEEWEGPKGQRSKVKRTTTIKDKECIAWAYDKATGDVLEGPPVSIGLAVAEGWYSKDGSKWVTMPELMLRYRAAKFFGNLYAPDVLMGMHTAEEVEDFVEPAPKATRQAPVGANDNSPAPAAHVNDLNEFASTQPAASTSVLEGELVDPETPAPAAAPAATTGRRQRRGQQQDPAPATTEQQAEQQQAEPVEPESQDEQQAQDPVAEQQQTTGATAAKKDLF